MGMSKGTPFDIPLFTLLPLVLIGYANPLVGNHIFTKRTSVVRTCLLGLVGAARKTLVFRSTWPNRRVAAMSRLSLYQFDCFISYAIK